MQTYKLDPCWYFTTPALSWDAMLLHTKVAIELFTDYDMLLFIEKGVRGDESDVGYILEVDLEYPSDLHDKHSDFPLAPENKPPPNYYDENTIYNLPLVNKKVIGKMKDENKGNIMTEYVGLKSKMRKTTQLVSRNETTQLGNMNETTQQEKTTQLGSMNEQLNSAARTKQLNLALPTTACTAFTAESAFSTYLRESFIKKFGVY
ncbi:uncharacterized protein TNCV_3500731 [Trichonephila clavipes]|nr:uncharacterized protein TNCV_3500731 [Trichonephila clavipes]